ncbi:hypothetical protein SHELI_v1c06440 [Spiroplasma helicoides]|uniref:Uncharacterized protein n=1 Tax=Spiroplasma helicoides TaxID=216938 RepID=A0A1B3SKZ4_9MOLU|nr:hypothetical protein [Spiroplasma helicoides]AOG60595.1 hypothetical protein SHELI_v1c06440 [Spiroplasma helicoides]
MTKRFKFISKNSNCSLKMSLVFFVFTILASLIIVYNKANFYVNMSMFLALFFMQILKLHLIVISKSFFYDIFQSLNELINETKKIIKKEIILKYTALIFVVMNIPLILTFGNIRILKLIDIFFILNFLIAGINILMGVLIMYLEIIIWENKNHILNTIFLLIKKISKKFKRFFIIQLVFFIDLLEKVKKTHFKSVINYKKAKLLKLTNCLNGDYL